MAKILVTDTNLTNIANAIREKNGETTSYKVDEMANAIENISVSSGATEDLSSELTTQNNLIATQETTIDNIISALEGKASGSSSGGLQEENVDVTLSITSTSSSYRPDISYLTYTNGEFIPNIIDVSTNNYSATLSVAKGSFLVIQKEEEMGAIVIKKSSTEDIEIFGSDNSVSIKIIQINGSSSLDVQVLSGAGSN